MTLSIPDDDLASCVSCGLCLPHCPTYRATGDEALSPRGRISLIRGLDSGALTLDVDAVHAIDSCIQCRGCETACPSDVPFGSMIATAQSAVAAGPRRGRARLLAPLTRLLAVGWLVRAASIVAGLGQRLGVVPSRRLGLPERIPLRRPRLDPTGDDAWLFTGCVMDAWQRDVHVDAIRVLDAVGCGVALPGAGGGCCGALAAHAGFTGEARRRAVAVIASMPGSAPVLVDSAGCGAMLKEYGHLLGTEEAERFGARVVDIGEWLAPRVATLPAPDPTTRTPLVAIQDPCHLRHAQRAHGHTRTLLAPFVETVELDDEGLCCGAGGAFSVTHPDLSDAVRTRKLASIARSGAPVVASANPGCSVHLARAGLDVRHPVSLVADAIGNRWAAAP